MPTEGTEFVESRDVVDVTMRVEDIVDLGEFFAQGLLAKVGPSVDENGAVLGLDMQGASRSRVARIGGSANGTGAADDRDAN